MALFYDKGGKESIEFEVFIEQLKSYGKNIFDRNNFEEVKLALQKLYNNRTFLTSHFNELLKNTSTQSNNLYTFQVFMLAQEKNFNIRAPIWVPPQGVDSDAAFVYGLSHDHNFDLMTLGYLGDGYITDIYQYDVSKVSINTLNQQIELFDLTRYQLKPGSILYMEKNKDVHTQLPPKELSISVNIMKTSNLSDRQFLFDTKAKKIIRKVDGEVSHSFFKLASYLGDENTIDIVECLSAKLKNRYEMQKNLCVEEIHKRIRC